MRNDWIFDAVQAEVAYRTEELKKAGRLDRVVDSRRWRRHRRGRLPEVQIPRQRDGETADVAGHPVRRAG